MLIMSSQERSPTNFEEIPNKNGDEGVINPKQLADKSSLRKLYWLDHHDQHQKGLAIKSMDGLPSLASD